MQKQANEKKNRKKGLYLTFFFHAILIGAALIPFLGRDAEDQPQYEAAIVVDFSDFSSAASTSAPKRTKKVKKQQKQVEKKVEQEKPKPEQKTKPLNTDELFEDPLPESEEPADEIDIPDPEPVMPVIEEVDTEEAAEEEGEIAEEASESGDGNDGDRGEGDHGDMDAGEGEGVDDFGGDGIFNRRVIKRGNVKSVTEQEGKIVINLCVNNEGRVTYADVDKAKSTIKNDYVLSKAEYCANQYIFERDYSVPKKQCGTLTFVFKIED